MFQQKKIHDDQAMPSKSQDWCWFQAYRIVARFYRRKREKRQFPTYKLEK